MAGYNAYIVYGRWNKNKNIEKLISLIELGYDDMCLTFYGVITFKKKHITPDAKKFRKGQKVIYLGGERIYGYGVSAIFWSTSIKIESIIFAMRDLFKPQNDEYLFEFKSLCEEAETELLKYEPIKQNVKSRWK